MKVEWCVVKWVLRKLWSYPDRAAGLPSSDGPARLPLHVALPGMVLDTEVGLVGVLGFGENPARTRSSRLVAGALGHVGCDVPNMLGWLPGVMESCALSVGILGALSCHAGARLRALALKLTGFF